MSILTGPSVACSAVSGICDRHAGNCVVCALDIFVPLHPALRDLAHSIEEFTRQIGQMRETLDRLRAAVEAQR